MTPDDLTDLINSPDDDRANSWVGRLVLSYLDADPLLSVGVADEIQSDPRGADVALWSVVVTLVDAQVRMWTATTPTADVAAQIRKGLAQIAGSKDNSNG